MSNEIELVLIAGVRLPLDEVRYEYSRSGGPGGQHANKTSTKVTLRVQVRDATWLPEQLSERVLGRLQSRLTTEGELVLHASEYRDRERNRAAALARMETLLNDALRPPVRRKKTRPTRGSVERRIQTARRRGAIKRMRRKPASDE